MLAFAGRLLAPYALKLLAGLAIAAAVAGVLLGVRNSGRQAERVERMQKDLQNVETRQAIERGSRDLDDDALDDRLRPPARRRRR